MRKHFISLNTANVIFFSLLLNGENSKEKCYDPKTMLYMIAIQSLNHDTPWKALDDRLVPVKCSYDERLGRYRGRMKVVGRGHHPDCCVLVELSQEGDWGRPYQTGKNIR